MIALKSSSSLSSSTDITYFLLISILLFGSFSLASATEEAEDLKTTGCVFGEARHAENATWTSECMSCTCRQTVPFCERLQCKYEACEQGKRLILSNDQCCPECQEPMQSCTYSGFFINVTFLDFSTKITHVRSVEVLFERRQESIYNLSEV